MLRRLALFSALFLSAADSGAADDVSWERVKLDATFRSEGVAAADVNRDGHLDVLAGDVWYASPGKGGYQAGAGPKWKMHALRRVGEYAPDKGYSQSFCNFARDVNGDGWDDLIVVGFPGAPFHWYENPKNEPGHWKEHLVWHSACNETPLFEDLDGDGRAELVLGSQPESQLGYIPLPPHEQAARKWTFHAISEKGNPGSNGSHRYYHGLGVGDVNRDGRNDVIIGHGWWEAPEDLKAVPWKFHPHVLSKTGTGNPLPCANIHADDLDLDGDSDLILSSAHAYGLWWFENVGGNKQPEFKYHLIDEAYSQTHALEYVDIDGDGRKDLVTGKRYFAHQGKDPGGREPVVMYWYRVEKTKGAPPRFVRHEIVAGRDTGVGTQFLVRDMNGDGRPDIVLSNKKGTNLLIQTGAKVGER